MALPKSITEAKDLDACYDNLFGLLPQNLKTNNGDAFQAILRRAHEIGWQQGGEMAKSLIRIRLGLDPISAHGNTISDYIRITQREVKQVGTMLLTPYGYLWGNDKAYGTEIDDSVSELMG